MPLSESSFTFAHERVAHANNHSQYYFPCSIIRVATVPSHMNMMEKLKIKYYCKDIYRRFPEADMHICILLKKTKKQKNKKQINK